MPKRVVTLDSGFKLMTHEDHIGRIVRKSKDYYERTVIVPFCDMVRDHEGVIIDVGANIGNHTVAFCHYLPDKEIISFEPNNDNIALLSYNLLANGVSDQVTLIHSGVGAHTGKASFSKVNEDNMGDCVLQALASSDNVTIVTLEETIPQLKPDTPVAGIKVDAQGWDLDVLKGASDLIRRDCPVIAYEAETNAERRDIPKFLERFGYKCYNVEGNRKFIANCYDE